MKCNACGEDATHYVDVIVSRLMASLEEVSEWRMSAPSGGSLPSREDAERKFGIETANPNGYYCRIHKGMRLLPDPNPDGWYVVERKVSRLPA